MAIVVKSPHCRPADVSSHVILPKPDITEVKSRMIKMRCKNLWWAPGRCSSHAIRRAPCNSLTSDRIPYRTKCHRTKFLSDKIFCRIKLTKFRVLEMEEKAVFWDIKLAILYCLRQLCETISSDKISSPSQNFVTFLRRNFVR